MASAALAEVAACASGCEQAEGLQRGERRSSSMPGGLAQLGARSGEAAGRAQELARLGTSGSSLGAGARPAAAAADSAAAQPPVEGVEGVT